MEQAPALPTDALLVSEPRSVDNARLFVQSGMLVMARPNEPMATIHAIELDSDRALEIASFLTRWARAQFRAEGGDWKVVIP